jgi:hypothetical protein
MAPRPIKPHDASLETEQEKLLMPVWIGVEDRRSAEDNNETVISVELA